jgi:hypothetical protein
MNKVMSSDVEGTKRKNIIEIALDFTAMVRLFCKGSKKQIINKLEDFFDDLPRIQSKEDYEVRHHGFCKWFQEQIRIADRKLKSGRVLPGGVPSYGQAAKILDVAIKVYVYYCSLPTEVVASRIVPFLHGAIDTDIMKHINSLDDVPAKVKARTIKAVDENLYRQLQSLLAHCQAGCIPECNRNLHPVQFDDLLWRHFARDSSASS